MAVTEFSAYKIVKPNDLNPNGSLSGGVLIHWIDEEAAMYAITILENSKVVTRYISDVKFESTATNGDFLVLRLKMLSFGTTSLTLSCNVINRVTGKCIITLDKIVFVNVNADGKPLAHNIRSQAEFLKDN